MRKARVVGGVVRWPRQRFWGREWTKSSDKMRFSDWKMNSISKLFFFFLIDLNWAKMIHFSWVIVGVLSI